MSDPSFYLTMAAAALAGLAMLVYAGLNGWRGWLQLKSQEMRQAGGPVDDMPVATGAGARIEIADLKERIRKLEAIAAGVEL